MSLRVLLDAKFHKSTLFALMLRRSLGLGSKYCHGLSRLLLPKALIEPQLYPPSLWVVLRRAYSGRRFKFNAEEQKEARHVESLPKYKQWAHYFGTQKFKKMMTKYYIAAFFVMLVAFYYYMNEKYYEEKHMKCIYSKYAKEPSSLSEYEFLKLKATSGNNLKPGEQKKFLLYQRMRKDAKKQGLIDGKELYDPSPQDLEEWYSKQEAKKIKVAVPGQEPEKTNLKNAMIEAPAEELNNYTNPAIQPAVDTTEIYDLLAEEYDDKVKWEERGILMGRKRRWLMKQAEGNVLEVACGTGRNLPYFDPNDDIKSITFMDSSPKMVEVCQKKFRKKYSKYKRAAFAVGRAEGLDALAHDSIKYDTIIEAFGLCAHEDPIKALQNMEKVLKPGGRIVLLEHGRSYYDFLNTHLDFRSEKRLRKWGCRWNLDIGEIVDDAGLDIVKEERAHFGSTWMLVCKRPEDPLRIEEKPFIKKLLGKEVYQIEKGK